jgi:hypothetical protein
MPECGLSGLIELHPIIARLGTIRRIIDFTKGVCWLFCNRIAGCTAHPRSATGQRRRSSPRPQCPQLPPIAGIRLIPNDRRLGRVEDGRGSLGHAATLRFPSPLIEPDVRISRIRLSDRLHREARETNHWPQALLLKRYLVLHSKFWLPMSERIPWSSGCIINMFVSTFWVHADRLVGSPISDNAGFRQ